MFDQFRLDRDVRYSPRSTEKADIAADLYGTNSRCNFKSEPLTRISLVAIRQKRAVLDLRHLNLAVGWSAQMPLLIAVCNC